MVAIATDTFATSMEPYPSQRHFSKGGGQKGRSQKKLGCLMFFTVFEYKANIANTCNNSRIVQVEDLSP